MPLPSLKNSKRSMGDRMRTANAALADKGGRMNKSIILPAGVRAFRPKGDQTYLFDILAYLVTNPNHPARIPAGEGWWHTLFHTHGRIGSQELTFTCPKLTFGKPCPICEEITRLRKDTSSDHKREIKALRAKERFLMYAVLHDRMEDGVYLVDQSDYMFGQPLREQVLMQEAEIGDFTDIVDGYTFKIKFNNAAFKNEESGEGGSFAKPGSSVFVKKRNKYPKELIAQIEALPSLDTLVQESSYEEMKQALDGYIPPVDFEHDDPPPPEEAQSEPPAKTIVVQKPTDKKPEPVKEPEPKDNPDGIDLDPEPPAEKEAEKEEEDDDPWS